MFILRKQGNVFHAKQLKTSDNQDKGAKPGTISREELAKHKTHQTGIWVAYNGGVYDITEFVENHPGGPSKIILAAGGDLEPYWAMYPVHKKDEVVEILEEYRIGELDPEQRASNVDENDPFKKEPQRHPALRPNSVKPFNAEPPLELLADSYVTPNELFFVRNHLPVPNLNEKDYRLEISGENMKPVILSLDELKTKYKKRTVTTTIQCAGNRRSEMNVVKKVKGLNWTQGAISTASWSGVLLKDVFESAGLDEDAMEKAGVQHIVFEGYDKDITGTTYGSSIPIDKAMSARGSVLLAYEMNGKPIPLDHGFPVRALVPGIVGARNVKWLSKVVASKTESTSHWQQNDYKGFCPSVDWDSVDFSSSPAIQDQPVTSAICQPSQDSKVSRDEEHVTIRGYAWSGGGRGIVRVDVSLDGGKTWSTANLEGVKQRDGRAWAWSLWEATLPIPSGLSKLAIVCKAVDSSYNVQPDNVAPIWNLRGVLSNAWHRVDVNVEE
ncbi:hypothetical protein QZH41_004806 [Actinostola sp. cb2023]|nr:hypothetical protein QZH41_004806 [Actinostola sp. cb2023]